MWKVFGYSFYGAIRCEDERSLAIKSHQYERSPEYADSLTQEALLFEQKYLACAESIIAGGPQPVLDPNEDPMLLEEK